MENKEKREKTRSDAKYKADDEFIRNVLLSGIDKQQSWTLLQIKALLPSKFQRHLTTHLQELIEDGTISLSRNAYSLTPEGRKIIQERAQNTIDTERRS
ncbi:MAG: hypothetical protein ABI758_00750 [Candidatus Woesebacteria bacterium]